MSYAVLKVNDSNFLKTISKFRVDIWNYENSEFCNVLGCDYMFEGLDFNSEHYVIIAEGKLAAAARLSFHSKLETIPDWNAFSNLHQLLQFPVGSINRMVVHPEFRGRGFSKILTAIRLKRCLDSGMRSIACLAIGSRKETLINAGFNYYGIAEKHAAIDHAIPNEMNIMIHHLDGLNDIVSEPFFDLGNSAPLNPFRGANIA
ncbi:MAG: GNAT family N-acetyltransferase [Oligoflexales bacterium]|nr:GNAT family N-acetyltransferase [Oligoflexales bacterium]